MKHSFPVDFPEVQEWALAHSVSSDDAGRRYAQYLILQAISRSSQLRQSMVFKGGNALEFVYLPNRSTTDLDFSFIEAQQDNRQILIDSRKALESALEVTRDGYGTLMRLQSIKQNPPRPDAHFATFTARIGYALPDHPNQQKRLLAGQPVANVIPVEMTANEIVCEWHPQSIGANNVRLLVSSLNDIVAEKLRAILQQKERNRHRSQDVLDIASIIRLESEHLDPSRVSDFLLRKCAARGVGANKSAFRDQEIRSRSETTYADLADTTRYTFIPFDEAWEIVMDLVDQLDIPD